MRPGAGDVSGDSGTARDSRAVALPLLVLAAYLGISLLYWGLPLLGHRDAYVGSSEGPDPKLYMWLLTWWPHALGHAHNPFVADAVWAPQGINLARLTAIPGPSLVAAPLTLLLGPLAAYNVLVIAAPALAAFTAFLLCRRITRSFWPSAVGGYLFGFSAYELGQMQGHLNLTLVFLVPLAVLLVLARIEGSMGARSFVLLLGLVLVGQFSISTEVFATMTVGGAGLLAATALFARPPVRSAVIRTAGLTALAYGLAGAVVSPYLYYAFQHGVQHVETHPIINSADVLGFLVPTQNILLGHGMGSSLAAHFTAASVENGDYVGVPLLVLTAFFAVTARRFRSTWLLLLALAGAAAASLGPVLRYEARAKVVLPWRVVERVPIIGSALPIRTFVFGWLALAIIVSLWLARAGRFVILRWALAGLVVASLLPNVGASLWRGQVDSRPVFATTAWRRYIPANSIVLMVPSGARAMYWQAETSMGFRLAAGYTGVYPPEHRRPLVARVFLGYLAPSDGPGLRRYVESHEARTVVVDWFDAGKIAGFLAPLHPKRAAIDGLVFLRLPA